MGIADAAADALGDCDFDSRACFRGIAHLLDEVSEHLSPLEQFIAQQYRNEGCPS